MKKIVALSLLSSLVGCTQLTSPTTPLQAPIKTINTTKLADILAEPAIVAELDSSVKTDPLYQSIDSIVVSEQAIKTPPVAKAVPTKEIAPIENSIIANEAVIVEPTVEVITAPVAAAVVDTETNAITVDTETDSRATSELTDEPAVTINDSSTIADEAITTDPSAAVVAEPAPDMTDTVATESTGSDYKTVTMHGYSVQIAALRNEQSLVTLLSSLDTHQPAWVNKKMLNGSQVYTLLLGHYSDYDQAKVALALLPKALQQNSAFVRNFYDIENSRSPQLKQLQ